jgi:hypothetical protein
LASTVEDFSDAAPFELRTIDRDPERRALLDRVAGIQRSSAEFLRRHGKTAAARGPRRQRRASG